MNFNPLDYPMVLRDPRHLPGHGAWVGHIPFGFALVEMMRPEAIVELGVFEGASYCAFCQAVAELGLRGTRCFGIDTWQGDAHTGAVDDRVLDALRAHHDPLYGGFSQFIRTDFDTAAAHVADGSIDLLHIDGLHTYDAVRHDYQTWRAKMSEQGVILFHDTAVRDAGFGVWRLWAELAPAFPSFEFTHSNGLGVLAVGARPRPAVLDFLAAAAANAERVRRLFEMLAERIEGERLLRQLGDFLNGAQAFLEGWQRRVGGAVGDGEDPPVDGHLDPMRAARRAARHLKSIAAATESPPPPPSPPSRPPRA